MKFIRNLIISGVLVLLIVGCSGYEKALKSTDYKLKYKMALQYYHKPDYVRAAALFDQIANVFRGTDQADTIFFYQAMSNFQQGDYILAQHYFHTLTQTYGGSPFAEESDYMSAYCYYMMSPRPELDQDNTIQAIQAFQLHLIRYPDSKRADDCRKYITELQNKLVKKSFLSAKLYFDMEDYKAAIVALNNCLTQYPDSRYREDIMYMLVKSSYLLAYKSVRSKQKDRYQNAVDEYYSFAAEYPNSKYSKEVEKYYKLASRVLGGDLDKTNEIDEN